MTKMEKLIFLLGKTQASIEALAYSARNDASNALYDLICDFEQSFNRDLSQALAMSFEEENSKCAVNQGRRITEWK